ncbi:MAG: DNA-directed RNA polymerase subunit omega [Clostridia bacterium]|nr:DNA-directed RNA polymerase subunit omega [Clostridia bacterium]
MLNPDLRGVLTNHVSRYSLVTATAKRARDISQKIEDDKAIVIEKPVTLALEEILNGDYYIVEPEEIRNI